MPVATWIIRSQHTVFIWSLYGFKPQSGPLLMYCQFGTSLWTSSKFDLLSRKSIWRCHLRNLDIFIQVPTGWHVGPIYFGKQILQNAVQPIQSHLYKPTLNALVWWRYPSRKRFSATHYADFKRHNCCFMWQVILHPPHPMPFLWHHKTVMAFQITGNTTVFQQLVQLKNIKSPHRAKFAGDRWMALTQRAS